MNTIKLYLHSENTKEPQVIEIDENASIKEIVVKHHEVKNPDGSFDEEYKIFIEDGEDCLHHDHNHKDCGIEDKSTVHCHRCEKVAVTLVYNGKDKHLEVAPSFTGEKIISKVADLFGIDPKDAADLRLKIDDLHFLEANEHIGTVVQFPHCKIELTLIPNPKVLG